MGMGMGLPFGVGFLHFPPSILELPLQRACVYRYSRRVLVLSMINYSATPLLALIKFICMHCPKNGSRFLCVCVWERRMVTAFRS